ncbi:MAG TPA: glycosyltransferase family 4 protein [Ignavibacteria bacterium]|nr:glycosyltransferase family 4 protein [Ignavibacteria bacterium]
MHNKTNNLKICIVTAILPPSYGGAEVAALKYALRLNSRKDSEVIIIGWDRSGSYLASDQKYDFIYPLSFYENPEDAKGLLIYFQQSYHLLKCFFALVKPMYRLRKHYDYIHNFNSGFAFNRVSIFIGKMLGKKVITETSLIGDDDPLSLGRFPHWTDYFKPKHLRYKFYKMADRYVSKSKVITEIYERSEIPMSKVSEIPYSVDIKKFNPTEAEEKRDLRKKLNLWEEGRIILFVGGINERKGVHLLVDAFTRIACSFPDLRLLIVGPTYKYDQNYVEGLKEKVLKEDLKDKVIFTEKSISNVDEYMKSSDIFILPSRQEGFPISVIEAMSCGLTVIGSDIPEIAKAQIDDGKDGFIFPSGNSDKLSELLERLLVDSDEMKKCGIRARAKAERYWSDEVVDDKYRELYLSIN